MRPFKRVKMLDADEYRVLTKTVASRKIAAGKARRAKMVLPSDQVHTANLAMGCATHGGTSAVG